MWLAPKNQKRSGNHPAPNVSNPSTTPLTWRQDAVQHFCNTVTRSTGRIRTCNYPLLGNGHSTVELPPIPSILLIGDGCQVGEAGLEPARVKNARTLLRRCTLDYSTFYVYQFRHSPILPRFKTEDFPRHSKRISPPERRIFSLKPHY